MLTLEAIQSAHAQFTGPDFPKLIQSFKEMGMKTNTVEIDSGCVFYTSDSHVLQTEGVRAQIAVATEADKVQVQSNLARHQAGQSDFQTFCDDMARAGIYKWIIDLETMTCSYYDKNEEIVISEVIPSGV
ncbi:DUF1398 domain-containing protein [Streptococcus sp. 20-1249]|uniref:DUF1398 domain-containing protein n=1 Tax=Streptococcus hepaticus TaxID=3349163 RepID=UPI00374A2B17